MPEEELKFESNVQGMLDEWHVTGQDVDHAVSLLDGIPPKQRQQFWVCALEYVCRTNKYRVQRATLVSLMQVFIHHDRLAVPGIVSTLMLVVDRSCRFEAWVDAPGLWRNFAYVVVQLMSAGILCCDNLVDICIPFFQQFQEEACRDALTCIMQAVQNTQQHHLYNAQVGLTLYQSLRREEQPLTCGTVDTVDGFVEMLLAC